MAYARFQSRWLTCGSHGAPKLRAMKSDQLAARPGMRVPVSVRRPAAFGSAVELANRDGVVADLLARSRTSRGIGDAPMVGQRTVTTYV